MIEFAYFLFASTVDKIRISLRSFLLIASTFGWELIGCDAIKYVGTDWLEMAIWSVNWKRRRFDIESIELREGRKNETEKQK